MFWCPLWRNKLYISSCCRSGEELLSFTVVVGMVVYWRQEATGITFAPSSRKMNHLLCFCGVFVFFCLRSNQVHEVLNMCLLDILHYFGTNGLHLNCSQLHRNNKVWPVIKYTTTLVAYNNRMVSRQSTDRYLFI